MLLFDVLRFLYWSRHIVFSWTWHTMSSKSPGEHLDKLFSRQMLGAVLVGGAAGKMVEKTLNLISGETFGLLVLWSISFVIFMGVFIYWDRLERATEDMTDDILDEDEE